MNGCAVSWAIHKEACNTLSTSEAEYVAMSDYAQELEWFRLYLAELGLKAIAYPHKIGPIRSRK